MRFLDGQGSSNEDEAGGVRERVEVFGDAMGDKSGVSVPCPTVR